MKKLDQQPDPRDGRCRTWTFYSDAFPRGLTTVLDCSNSENLDDLIIFLKQTGLLIWALLYR